MTRSEFILKWERQPVAKTNCFYCGRPFHPGGEHSPRRKTIEHIVPQHEYKGCQPLRNNIVNACSGCNNAKNGGTVREFRDWYAQRFFCEILLHENYPYTDNSPAGDGTRDFGLNRLIERSFRKVMCDIDERFEKLRRQLKHDRTVFRLRNQRPA